MNNKYTKEVTQRYAKCVNDIIAKNKKSGGKYSTLPKFGKSIGQHYANIHKIISGKGEVGMVVFEATCRVHRLNPTYLTLGIGEVYLSDKSKPKTLTEAIDDLQEGVDRIRLMVK